MNPLLSSEIRVINIGLKSFSEPIRAHGGTALDLEWRPPAEGNSQAGMALAELINHPQVNAANQTAYERYLSAQPVLVGLGVARDELPGFGARTLLHSGPPISWSAMCGPQKGAVLGAILYEGWAKTLGEAEALVVGGGVNLDACNHHNAVGPMAGVISPSMPVWIVENTTNGHRSYCNLNEGLGKVLRFGANSPEVLERLVWMRDVLAPTLKVILASLGPVALKPLMAQALHMGDEVHNRNAAASALFFKKLTLAALGELPSLDLQKVRETLAFVASNDHFFLNLSMAACKGMLQAAEGVKNSTLVTVMARNGVDFGIQLSGLPGQWFTAPANFIEGLYFSGYSRDDAARDLGDSAITETAGLGGFSMAASPAIVQFVGGTPADAIANTRRMLHITLGQNAAFTLPPLDFGGCPAGIDARKVVDTSILPVINTGIAHQQAGIGQIGAGITNAPLACFVQALEALALKGVQ
ncbi:MAG: DUF1116 domain-containing protein [Spirochaetales bacterium]